MLQATWAASTAAANDQMPVAESALFALVFWMCSQAGCSAKHCWLLTRTSLGIGKKLANGLTLLLAATSKGPLRTCASRAVATERRLIWLTYQVSPCISLETSANSFEEVSDLNAVSIERRQRLLMQTHVLQTID